MFLSWFKYFTRRLERHVLLRSTQQPCCAKRCGCVLLSVGTFDPSSLVFCLQNRQTSRSSSTSISWFARGLRLQQQTVSALSNSHWQRSAVERKAWLRFTEYDVKWILFIRRHNEDDQREYGEVHLAGRLLHVQLCPNHHKSSTLEKIKVVVAAKQLDGFRDALATRRPNARSTNDKWNSGSAAVA